MPGDSLWTNVWNGENRRVTVESRSTLPAAGKRKVAWTILADGRWVERIVSTNNGTAYYPSQTNRYVWDNQVLLAVLDHTNGVVSSFLRGLDLSGSLQGAGGVGGVLFIGHFASAIGHHAVAYDGNGNVTALLNAATGEESARYEYGPFAEGIRMTGPLAKLNPIRFSTQYADDVTGDTKYLFRDYQADAGRWLSRDPVMESGFVLTKTVNTGTGSPDTYVFVANGPLNATDYLGLALPPGWPWGMDLGTYASCNFSDPCAEAKKRGMDKGHVAGVICCGGSAHVCIWNPPLSTQLGGRPGFETAAKIILDCITRHENEHIRQGPCGGCGFYRKTIANRNKDQTECDAYYAEAQCLLAGLAGCGGDPDCEKLVKTELKDVTLRVQEHCGAAK